MTMNDHDNQARIMGAIAMIEDGEPRDSLNDMSWAIALINRAREATVDGRKLDADSNMAVAIYYLTRARTTLEKE